jgi:hypothetical protein
MSLNNGSVLTSISPFPSSTSAITSFSHPNMWSSYFADLMS